MRCERHRAINLNIFEVKHMLGCMQSTPQRSIMEEDGQEFSRDEHGDTVNRVACEGEGCRPSAQQAALGHCSPLIKFRETPGGSSVGAALFGQPGKEHCFARALGCKRLREQQHQKSRNCCH